jgi:DNA helicase-2/ATP-dependent DNA helicase PcrA
MGEAEDQLSSLPADAGDDDDNIVNRDRRAKVLAAGKVYRAYERIKSENVDTQRGNIDYGDMIVLSHRLLSTQKIVAASLRQRIKYILVDEFQDANYAQVEILHHLAGIKCGITVVGDDDQAIYRFRGASFASFKLFQQLFPDARVHKLEENYRSTSNIVRAAQSIIEIDPGARFESQKKMFSSGDPGEKVEVRICPDYRTEAESVADEIESLLKIETYNKPKSIAVLFRARRHKDLLAGMLQRRGIDFYYDKKLEESSSQPVKLLKTLYEFAIDSSRRDLLAMIIHHFMPGIKPDLEREIGYKLSRGESEPLDIARSIASESDGAFSADLLNLIDLLNELRDLTANKNPLQLLEILLSRAGILSSVIVNEQIIDHQAMTDIAGILRDADSFLQENDTGSHQAFLEYLNWKAGYSEDESDIEDTEAPVVLQTVHGSKGLEYPVVFVIGLSNNRFPPRRRSATVEFPAELYKDELPIGDYRIQEERRLFYVAMTRARERLYLHGLEKKGTRLSQFIKELTGQPIFDEVGETKRIEQTTTLPEIGVGPDIAIDGTRSIVIPGSAPIEDALPESILKLWRLQSSKVQTPEEFERVKDEFKSKIDSSLSELKSRIDREKFIPRQPDQRYKVDRVSYTDLEAFDTCPLKFYYRKILRMPSPPSPYQLLGQVIHTVLEEAGKSMIDSKAMVLDSLIAEFESRWRKIHLSDPDQKERLMQRGRELLDNFVDLQSRRPGKPELFEKSFELELPNARLTGRIDRVDKTPSGLAVIDYKTGKKDDAKLKKDLQLPIYSLACKEIFGEYPSSLIFMFLRDGKIHEDSFEPEALEAKRSEIEDRIEKINLSDFAATPGFVCGFCDFQPICPAREAN